MPGLWRRRGLPVSAPLSPCPLLGVFTSGVCFPCPPVPAASVLLFLSFLSSLLRACFALLLPVGFWVLGRALVRPRLFSAFSSGLFLSFCALVGSLVVCGSSLWVSCLLSSVAPSCFSCVALACLCWFCSLAALSVLPSWLLALSLFVPSAVFVRPFFSLSCLCLVFSSSLSGGTSLALFSLLLWGGGHLLGFSLLCPLYILRSFVFPLHAPVSLFLTSFFSLLPPSSSQRLFSSPVRLSSPAGTLYPFPVTLSPFSFALVFTLPLCLRAFGMPILPLLPPCTLTLISLS